MFFLYLLNKLHLFKNSSFQGKLKYFHKGLYMLMNLKNQDFILLPSYG